MLITGRTLHAQARDVLRTVRKACAFLQQYVFEDGTPRYSGDNLEDCFNKILDDMYSYTKGRQTVPSESPKPNANLAQQESEETSDVEEENNSFVESPEKPHRPDTWFFQGYMLERLSQESTHWF